MDGRMLRFGLFWFGERERGDIEFGLLPGEFAIGGEGMERGRLFRKPGLAEQESEELRL